MVAFSRQLVLFLQKNLKPSYILGNGTSWKASIVIGIPSVKRSTASYLFKTLHSLFHDMYPGNEERVCVVVFLAEEDRDFVESTGKLVFQILIDDFFAVAVICMVYVCATDNPDKKHACSSFAYPTSGFKAP